jgi:hypothetical protein
MHDWSTLFWLQAARRWRKLFLQPKELQDFSRGVSCSVEILLVDVEFPVKYCDGVAVCVYNIVEVTCAIDSLKSPRLEASALILDIREACDNWDEI